MHDAKIKPDTAAPLPTGAKAIVPDHDEPEMLVVAYGQLVRRIAWHVHSRLSTAIEIDDLMQIGLVALVEAANGFEDRGLSFAPYARTRIKGAMIDALRRDARLSRSGIVNRRKIAGVRGRVEQQLMRRASDTEMAHAMGLCLYEYHVMADAAQAVQQESLDETYSDHDLWFADLAERADTLLERAQLQEQMVTALQHLSEREQLVLQLYFSEELNLDEIGHTLDIGAARVCQIKRAALDKLRMLLDD